MRPTSRADWFASPHISGARLSPDGRQIGFLSARGGTVDAFVVAAEHWGPAAIARARPCTHERGRGVAELWWSADGRALIFACDARGDESLQLSAVELSSGARRALSPAAGVNTRFVAARAGKPGWIAVADNARDARWHDLWAVELRSGRRELLWRNDDRLFGFVVDSALRPALAMRAERDGRTVLSLDSGAATPWLALPAQDELVSRLVGTSRDGAIAYWVSARGRDRGALVASARGRTEEQVLVEDEHADVDEVVFCPELGQPLAASWQAHAPRWVGLGPHVDDVAWLVAELGPAFSVLSTSADGARWLVVREHPACPPAVHVVDLPARVLGPGAPRWPALQGRALASMRERQVRARDGLALTALITEPARPRPPGGFPAVLWVHGGPWRRDLWRYDARHQWLADRGIAVIAVNFRGSTGQGKAFVSAGDLEWGRKMQTDLLDAVDALAEDGVIDRARVAIAGGSYGGYAALAALAFAPRAFACGVSICGPSNLLSSQTQKPAYWASVAEQRARRVGDPRTEAGRALLRERSPLFSASQICRPLLVAHGANDPRVARAESEQVVRAAAAHGVAVTYVVFGDEGHGLVREVNRVAFYAVMEAFLAAHLGADAEPLGDELLRACIDELHGAEAVPGLAAAWARR